LGRTDGIAAARRAQTAEEDSRVTPLWCPPPRRITELRCHWPCVLSTYRDVNGFDSGSAVKSIGNVATKVSAVDQEKPGRDRALRRA
jgi:hypothetical protein